jgi:nucleotide-binding universal stress UspA family protein
MINFRTIVCPVDFSQQSLHALDYALSLARHYNSTLVLCHVVEIQVITPPMEPLIAVGSVLENVTSTASEELKKLAEGLKPRVSKLIPILCEGTPSEETLRVAKDHSADLLVIGTHGRSGIDRLIFGSTTENILHKSTCPVLIVHTSEREFIDSARDEIKPVRILLGTDFSACSDQAFDYAVDLSKQYGAKLTAVHVNETSDDVTTTESLKQKIAQRLSNGQSVEVEPIILSGKPNKELVKFAAQNEVDLIVIGAHNLGLLRSLFFGSEAEKIIRSAPCPVLSICESSRPPDQTE